MAKIILPTEVNNILLVLKQFRIVSRLATDNTYSLAVNLVFFCMGGALGFSLNSSAHIDIVESLISFCSIIIGFVITAMLFSGRNQAADKLRLAQARDYATKTKFILLSQTQTLIAFLFCVGFSLLTIMTKSSGTSMLDSFMVFALAIGFFSLGVYRVIFLPFQIYDVHAFALDSLILEKEDQERSKVSSIAEGFKSKDAS